MRYYINIEYTFFCYFIRCLLTFDITLYSILTLIAVDATVSINIFTCKNTLSAEALDVCINTTNLIAFVK